MERKNKHRARLWLQSEKAMGQPSVPRPRRRTRSAPQMPEEVTTSAPTPPSRPVSAPAPRQPLLVVSDAASPSSIGPAAARPILPTDPPFSSPVLSRQKKAEVLAAMDANEVQGCVKCNLCQTRTRTVFGEGDPDAKIMFIGEGPGDNEDRTGRPFVGRSGELLDRMIAGMGFSREQVFIANLVKCRAYVVGPPHKDRAPMPEEVAACSPYLVRQLEIIRPQAIVTLGLPAAKFMLADPRIAMGRIRGQWQVWRGIALMPTYHPAYILRSYTAEVRGAVWDDLKQVLRKIGLPVPASGVSKS